MPYDQTQLQQLKLKTGDIVLFSDATILGNAIQKVTNSPWTHIGMVVVADDGCIQFFVTEDSYTGLGVQINPLDLALNDEVAFGSMQRKAFRRLKHEFSREQNQQVQQFIQENLGKPYQIDPLEFLPAIAHDPGTSKQVVSSLLAKLLPPSFTDELGDVINKLMLLATSIGLYKTCASAEKSMPNAMFCSELVSAALEAVGLMDKDLVINSFAPVDFAQSNPNDAQFNADSIYLPLETFPDPATPVDANSVLAADLQLFMHNLPQEMAKTAEILIDPVERAVNLALEESIASTVLAFEQTKAAAPSLAGSTAELPAGRPVAAPARCCSLL